MGLRGGVSSEVVRSVQKCEGRGPLGRRRRSLGSGSYDICKAEMGAVYGASEARHCWERAFSLEDPMPIQAHSQAAARGGNGVGSPCTQDDPTRSSAGPIPFLFF